MGYATFSTWLNSNSTGVERPKIVTITFRVSRSSFTSSTMPVKRRERSFADAHRFVLLELDFELRLLAAVGNFVDDVLHFFFRERRRLLAGADESSDARRGLHHVPDVIVHVHFNQHVAGIEHALGGVLLAAADFGHRFGRDQHFADLLLQPEGVDPRLQRFFHLALKARVGVDDVPLHVRILGASAVAAAPSAPAAASPAAVVSFVFFFVQHHGVLLLRPAIRLRIRLVRRS